MSLGYIEVIFLGLAAGVLVGLMGIGGGIILVPMLVYLMHMDQHMAQGTSLLVLLPPTGIGALYLYWKQRHVDLTAGLVCAAGFLLGGFFGSRLAIHTNSRNLQGLFGCFLMTAALLLWRKSRRASEFKPEGKVNA
jgi:uncharacterized membrane protein YfcA